MNIQEYNTFIRDENYEKIKNFLIKEVLNLDSLKMEDFKFILKDFSLKHTHMYDKDIQGSLDFLFVSKKFNEIINIFENIENDKIFIKIYIMKSYYALGQVKKYEELRDKIFNEIKDKKLWNIGSSYFSNLEGIQNKEEVLLSKVEYYLNTHQNEKLESYLFDLIDLEIIETEFVQALNIIKIFDTELWYRIDLYLRVKKKIVSNDDKVEALILFHERKINFRIKGKKLKTTISYKEEEPEQKEYIDTTTEKRKEETKRKIKYIQTEEERILILKINSKDPQFENLNRDLIISFLNMEMYELVVNYIERFEESEDLLYLKCEALLQQGKYSKVIDIINSRVKEETIAFKYLKAIAYREMGFAQHFKKELKLIAQDDSKFRKTRELLDES